jgi:tRNA nucleotidyltransferase/poly(A) polymerase
MKLAQTSKRTEHQALVYEAINKLRYFCRLYNIDSLFVVGGFCRAKYLARTWEVKDIDVASAYPSQAQLLGGLFASEIAETVPTYYHRTGTVGIDYKSDHGTITIEFQGTSAQSYMNNQDVREWLHSRNIDDVPLMQNVYGRDFTINALLYSLKSGDLIDVTGRAVADFERKKIVSLLPARLLVKNNPMVVLRAIRFSLQYDFLIHGALQDEMRGVEPVLKTLF